MPEQVLLPSGPTPGRLTPASFPFFTSGEDNLRVVSYNAAPQVHLKINARLIDPNGKAVASSWDHSPNTDRSPKTSDLTLSGSTLLNVTVFASNGAPLIGQTFVIVQLVRGLGAAAIVLGTVLQGYVTSAQAIGWPGSPILSSTDVTPALRTFAVTPLTPGADWALTIPPGARWDVVALYTRFIADATLGARTVFLQLQDVNVGNLAFLPFPATIAPSADVTISFGRNLPKDSSLAAAQVGPLPDQLSLVFGQSIGTHTVGLGAGDVWNTVNITVREFLEVS